MIPFITDFIVKEEKPMRKPLVTRIAPILAGAIRQKRESTGQPVRFRKIKQRKAHA